jgi:hypothetical protein
MAISRRQFLLGPASGLVAVMVHPLRALGQQAAQEITLSTLAMTAGAYLYLPFDVPEGVKRIAVRITRSGGDAKTGVPPDRLEA